MDHSVVVDDYRNERHLKHDPLSALLLLVVVLAKDRNQKEHLLLDQEMPMIKIRFYSMA